MNQWKIGDVTITRVIEMQVTGGTRFLLPDATREAVQQMSWLTPQFADAEGNLIMSIHALVVETPDRKMLVDTCIGNDKQRAIPNWNNLQLPFLQDLQQAGYNRMDIDTVMCTHLHVDHVGWNTMLVNDQWIPTFPNARYLIGQQEYQYWHSADAMDTGNDILSDSVQPVFEAGLVDLVDTDHRVCKEITFESTPGHTPGHISVHIESRGQHALITGDCIHHPCQMEKNEWCSTADYDKDQGMQTRSSLLSKYCDNSTLIIGTHFATPTAGYIRQSESGYWLDTVQALS